MQLEFPYQIVTFLGQEPMVNEPVYEGRNGWYPQLTLKRRFTLDGLDEPRLIQLLKNFFNQLDPPDIITGELIKPERMPVQVIDILNQAELKKLHLDLIHAIEAGIMSRYPERDGENYYPHITAEYHNAFVIPVDEYANKKFSLTNSWLLKDTGDGDSLAYIKIT